MAAPPPASRGDASGVGNAHRVGNGRGSISSSAVCRWGLGQGHRMGTQGGGDGLRKSRLTPTASAGGIKANMDGGTLIGNSSTAFQKHLLAKCLEPCQTKALSGSCCLFSLGQGELQPGQVLCPKHSAHPGDLLQADTEPACAKTSVFVQKAAKGQPGAVRNKTAFGKETSPSRTDGLRAQHSTSVGPVWPRPSASLLASVP